MRITNCYIPDGKLVYLLTPAEKDDKSKYLAQAGFSLERPDELREAIHQLISNHDAEYDRQNCWGRYYNVIGPLYGPDGIVAVVTVWIQKESDGDYSFVTLVPSK